MNMKHIISILTHKYLARNHCATLVLNTTLVRFDFYFITLFHGAHKMRKAKKISSKSKRKDNEHNYT